MCVVSMVGDHYRDKWTDPYRWPHHPIVPTPLPPLVPVPPVRSPLTNDEVIRRAIELTRSLEEARQQQEQQNKTQKGGPPSLDENEIFDSESTRQQVKYLKQQVDRLKEEVLEMRELLQRAAQYDRDNNEPHCEMADKVDLLKKMAELMDVNLGDVFKENP